MKKMFLLLGVTTIMGLNFISCSDDDNTINDAINNATPSADFLIKDGDNVVLEKDYSGTIAGSKAADMTTILASSITGFPSMTVYLSNSTIGEQKVSIGVADLSNTSIISKNTIIVSTSTTEYYIMVSGSITIETSSDKSIKGSFTGNVIESSSIIGSASVLEALLLGGNLKTISGNFKTYSLKHIL